MKTIGQIALWAIIIGFFILSAPDGGVAKLVHKSGAAMRATATAFVEGLKDDNTKSPEN